MTLIEQIRNDRYGSEHTDAYAKGWNDASKHVEGLVRKYTGLGELVEAKAMDMRVKAALTGVDE
jgi:hypothetical protein